jgi:hypothetical protein
MANGRFGRAGFFVLHCPATRSEQFRTFPRNDGNSTRHETRHGDGGWDQFDADRKTEYALCWRLDLDALTVTQLAEIASANARSVQHWAASGILFASPVSNRKGTGTPRLFPNDEAIVACIMQALHDRQMPIGAMLRVASIVRASLLSHVGGHRLLLNRIILNGQKAWFVDLGNENDNAAKIVLNSDDKFGLVFEGMKVNSTALVIDLAAALAGVRGRIPGY